MATISRTGRVAHSAVDENPSGVPNGRKESGKGAGGSQGRRKITLRQGAGLEARNIEGGQGEGHSALVEAFHPVRQSVSQQGLRQARPMVVTAQIKKGVPRGRGDSYS